MLLAVWNTQENVVIEKLPKNMKEMLIAFFGYLAEVVGMIT